MSSIGEDGDYRMSYAEPIERRARRHSSTGELCYTSASRSVVVDIYRRDIDLPLKQENAVESDCALRTDKLHFLDATRLRHVQSFRIHWDKLSPFI